MATKTATKTATTFAVIQTGGKQYKVEKGDVIEVERLEGDKHTFAPVMLVSRGEVRATPTELEGARVTAKVLGAALGPKIDGFTYKPKTNQRKRWGHRQHLVRLEITDIKTGASDDGTEKAGQRAGRAEKSGE